MTNSEIERVRFLHFRVLVQKQRIQKHNFGWFESYQSDQTLLNSRDPLEPVL